MGSMPRKSLAEIVLSEYRRIEEEAGEKYLVVYDFKLTLRRSIPEKFYRNLSRIMKWGRCEFVQKSVLLCEGLSTALAVAKLARHYGAEVKVFRVYPITV